MIKIEQEYLIMDYTVKLNTALETLKKFVVKSKCSPLYKNRIFFRQEDNGDAYLFATDAKAMYIYKLNSEVYNAKEKMLPLEWKSWQIDKDKKIIQFTIDDWAAPPVKRFIKANNSPFSIEIQDRKAFISFCETALKKYSDRIKKEYVVIQFCREGEAFCVKSGINDTVFGYHFDNCAADNIALCNKDIVDLLIKRPITLNAKRLKTILSCLKTKTLIFDFYKDLSAIKFSDGRNYYWLAVAFIQR